MNADSDKFRQTLVEQLTSFEHRLDSKIDDVRMLADIQEEVGRIIGADGANEAEVRRVLQERYESGDLRKETFQLVKSMLDRYVSEKVPTSPGFGDKTAANASDALLGFEHPTPHVAADDALSATTVIPAEDVSAAGSADERVQVGSMLRDRFMLQERVTGGGMGVIYKAMDRRLAEGGSKTPWVAVKVLSPQLAEYGQALRALQQEAAKGRCLTHPNIVRFMDLDRDDDLYFMVMEWLDGATLADILDSPGMGRFDQARSFKIVKQIGNALDYAHRCGIVHADVKPGNIMIMPNGDAKLFDFGVARVRQKQMATQPDFDPGVLGLMTPAYSSMQVLTGEEPTPADDVFSLACLLYRLLAGYRVFGPRNAAEAAEEGMHPQKLADLDDEQWRVLKKALSYSRVTRYESMAEFVEALDMEGDSSEPAPLAITAPPRDEFAIDDGSGSAGKVVVGLILVLGAAGAAAWHYGYLEEIKQQLGIGEFADPALPIATDVSAEVIEPAPAKSDLTNATDVRVEAQADDGNAGTPLAAPQLETQVFDNGTAATQGTGSGAELPAANSTVAVDAAGANVEQTLDDLAETDGTDKGTQVAAEMVIDPVGIDEHVDDRVEIEEPVEDPVEVEEPVEPDVPLVDFSLLPPPTAELRITENGGRAGSVSVRLREDGRPVTIDLVRDNTATSFTVRVEEVRFSGNRSPWVSGQLSISGDGLYEFPVGQNRARVTLSMASDPVREADQQITLRVRDADSAATELALINAVLEDDDQRAFEGTLPPNTVGFATSQVSVREQDPAVQIDILRFNPDNTRLVIGFQLRDITATQGEDYFAPGNYTVEFGPGQRSARILIPLVQDSEYEDNEAFSVELSTAGSAVDRDIYLRTAVMIRDDDL